MACPQLKILRAVVALDEVAVMHRLTGPQRTAQHFGHHQDVLGDPAVLGLGVRVFGVAANEHIALGIDPAILAAPTLADGNELALPHLLSMGTAVAEGEMLSAAPWEVANIPARLERR